MSTSLFAIQVGHIGNRILCLPALNLGNKCGKKWFVRPDQGHHAKNVGKSTIQRVSFFLLTKPPWTQNHETNRLRIWLEFKNFVFAEVRRHHARISCIWNCFFVFEKELAPEISEFLWLKIRVTCKRVDPGRWF